MTFAIPFRIGWVKDTGPRVHASGARAGFSLIEIMIVIAIAGIMLAMGIPSILRAMKRNDLTTAAQNVMEGCAYAREMAIFKGVPHDFVINADRSLTIEAAPNWHPISSANPGGSFEGAPRRTAAPSAAALGFRRTLTDTIYVDALAVNFVDMDKTDTDKVRVRFHPNGTSDEFTIVLNGVEEGMRKITLDIVTGKPMLESPR